MSRSRLVVVGGGLAGMRAALVAADAGCEVTLIERRRKLGGLTWSFERHGRWFDNGQHVFMRCCNEYRSLLERLGMSGSVTLQPRLDVPVLSPGGTRASIRRSGLPAPLHLAGAIARYRHLSVADRCLLARVVFALQKLDPEDPELDNVTFGEFLAGRGQSPRAVAALWNLIVLPTLNVSAQRASLALAVKVFRTGLLDTPDGGDMGWSNVPLGQLHGEAGERALRSAGVEMVLGAAAEQISRRGDGFVIGVGARSVDANAVVVATPPPVTASLVPASAGLPDLSGLGTSPIVNVHLVLDRRVTDLPFAAAIDSPVQFVFDRTGSSGSGSGSGREQCLAVSLSGADAYIGQPKDELIRIFFAAVGELFPKARHATLVDAVVTRERAATFAAVAGSHRFRPKAATAVPGLFVAGAWCDTGWPATMEGAVRSGSAAARAAVEAVASLDVGGADAPAPPEAIEPVAPIDRRPTAVPGPLRVPEEASW
ncbi:MAG TPA: hydroxysqualene dehydroxylase HpnE [Acidimicrobiales bacterium]|nr:hydroxysqualene dehydroxylase HpnE [Acidimicrobiales bacterium]